MTFLDTFSMSPETAALVAALNRLEQASAEPDITSYGRRRLRHAIEHLEDQLALALNPDTHPDLLHFRRR